MDMRKRYFKKIEQAGYDIISASKNMEDFYLKSDSGSIIRRIYDKDTNKSYEFSSKTIDKFNQIVDKLNSL